MSEISTLDPDSYLAPGGVEDVMNLSSRSSSISSSEDILSAENSSETAKERSRSRSTKDKKEKESFCPALYAKNAYSLINTLLSTYKPTHILIERQRFRSAGGSAVQEWTIRVGVFEGMLYAVLETILQERGLSKNLAPMQIHGIEPKRVVKYWIDKERGGEKMTAREVKKAKIEIVGKWLEEGRVGVVEGDVTELVGGYLGKLRKEGKNTVQIGKLDDLADCLLQGVTWLEWEGMRRRLGRDGFGGLEG
jgi:cruciform cutting endonuclease 1